MSFNFELLKQKYGKKQAQKEQKQKQQKLMLFQEMKLNPLVVAECQKVQQQYKQYYNNNRYFYLHADPQEIDTIDKIKHEQFNKIRKQSQISLIPPPPAVFKPVPVVSQKKLFKQKAQQEQKFRKLAYLFRKNIMIICKRMKQLKLTMKDIFEKEIFSRKPYLFGKDVFQAVKTGDEAKVWRIYMQNRFVIYSVDSTQKSLLIWACIRGFPSIVSLLIEMGASTSHEDIHHRNAMWYAIQYKKADCVKFLLLNKATLTEEDIQASKQDKKIKNIVELSRTIMSIIGRMSYEKRTAFFQDRLKYGT